MRLFHVIFSMLFCDFVYAEHISKTQPMTVVQWQHPFPGYALLITFITGIVGVLLLQGLKLINERSRQIRVSKKGLLPSGSSAVFGSLLPRCDSRLSA